MLELLLNRLAAMVADEECYGLPGNRPPVGLVWVFPIIGSERDVGDKGIGAL